VLRNSVLSHSSRPAASPDLTVKGTAAGIIAALMGGNPGQAVAQGMIQVQGRAAALDELLSLTTAPDFWFPVVTRPAWRE
jgi:alkyl sulfatase BDS1-like metallo-beta-lactamase superfamily hydrolase